MALTFLLDEHLRGLLPRAIRQHNARGIDPIDALCVGDPPDLPLGSSDPDILGWAEQHDRLLLTFDVRTMKSCLAQHLQAGRHSPGVLILNQGLSIRDIIDTLALIAHAGNPADYADRAVHVP